MIHQEVTLPASPDRVYAVLTDGKLFTQATGGRAAEIGGLEGASFSPFGAAIQGTSAPAPLGSRTCGTGVRSCRPVMCSDGCLGGGRSAPTSAAGSCETSVRVWS